MLIAEVLRDVIQTSGILDSPLNQMDPQTREIEGSTAELVQREGDQYASRISSASRAPLSGMQ